MQQSTWSEPVCSWCCRYLEVTQRVVPPTCTRKTSRTFWLFLPPTTPSNDGGRRRTTRRWWWWWCGGWIPHEHVHFVPRSTSFPFVWFDRWHSWLVLRSLLTDVPILQCGFEQHRPIATTLHCHTWHKKTKKQKNKTFNHCFKKNIQP